MKSSEKPLQPMLLSWSFALVRVGSLCAVLVGGCNDTGKMTIVAATSWTAPAGLLPDPHVEVCECRNGRQARKKNADIARCFGNGFKALHFSVVGLTTANVKHVCERYSRHQSGAASKLS